GRRPSVDCPAANCGAATAPDRPARHDGRIVVAIHVMIVDMRSTSRWPSPRMGQCPAFASNGGTSACYTLTQRNSNAAPMPDSKPLDPALREALESVTTATLTTVLLKKGLRNVWIRGAAPLGPAAAQGRRAGRAFTLRFVPAREDLATPASWGSPISTRAAIEAIPEGAVAVVDAMGVAHAGIFGDILCARMKKRGVAALVSDGVVRDVAGVLSTG